MKKFIYSFLILIFSFVYIGNVYAFSPNATVACYEDTSNLNAYNTESTSSGTAFSLSCGQKIEILSSVETTGTCSYRFKVSNGSKTGFVCGHYIITTKLSDFAENYYKNTENKESYIQRLKNEQIPDSYISYLLEIHARHPNWTFNIEKINLDWNDVVYNEHLKGNSLIWYTADPNYRSTEYNYDWLNDKFTNVSGEENWYYASQKAVSFYLDPRNFLNEKYIFSMEDLSYTKEYKNVVSNLLSNSFFPNLYKNYYNNTPNSDGSSGDYSLDVVNVGKNNGLSTIHISARILQEMGTNGSIASSGNTFNYCDTNKKDFRCYRDGASIINPNSSASGYFNFYNIGASATKYNTNVINGLIYAMGGMEKSKTSYARPWNTPYKSINGGAKFIVGDYVSINQDTIYYQKFDVSTNDGNYSHQFQQNITAHISEGGKTFSGYKNVSGLLNTNFSFTIPVYNNMPLNNSENPVLGSPNNYLKEIKINNKLLENFSYNKLEGYNVSVPLATTSINVSASKINDQASIKGIGNVKLTSNKQEINIEVTAGNGEKKVYKINIIREDDPKISITEVLDNSSVKYNDNIIYGIEVGTNVSSLITNVKNVTNYAKIKITGLDGNEKTNDSFRTGDTVTVTSNNETKNYKVIIYGDMDGNGEINKSDLLLIKRHIYKYSELKDSYYQASDVDKNGKVDKSDLLLVKRHIYGYGNISQK